jgi:hypothetical protein
MTWTYTDVGAALEAVELAVRETVADNPELAESEDSIFWDLCQSIQYDCDPATRRELARITGVSLIDR